jgi:hypothetical protein
MNLDFCCYDITLNLQKNYVFIIMMTIDDPYYFRNDMKAEI